MKRIYISGPMTGLNRTSTTRPSMQRPSYCAPRDSRSRTLLKTQSPSADLGPATRLSY